MKKEITLTIEEDDILDGRFVIISQVKGFPKWQESIDGEDRTFSSREEAKKYIPGVKKEIENSNSEAKVTFKDKK